MPPTTAHIDDVSRFWAALIVASVLVVVLAILHDPSKPVDESSFKGASASASTSSVDSVRAARERKRMAIRQPGTYLSLTVREDSVLMRWTDRRNQPIAVHLPRGVGVRGLESRFTDAVRRAFKRWEQVRDVPLRFAFIRDSSQAEVRIMWRPRLEGDRAGEANVEWDQNGWIRRGTLTLATRSLDGDILTSDAVYTVALHEIGHLVGVGHSDDAADLMHPTPGVHDLTRRDERTATLLYSLAPGSLRDPIAQ